MTISLEECQEIVAESIGKLREYADEKEPLLKKVPTIKGIEDDLEEISDEFKKNQMREKNIKAAVELAKTNTQLILDKINPVAEDEVGVHRIVAGRSTEERAGVIDNMADDARKGVSDCEKGRLHLREAVKDLRKRYDRAVAECDRRRDPQNPQTYVDLGNAKASLATIDRYLRLV